MATASTVRRFRRPFSSGASSLTLQDRHRPSDGRLVVDGIVDRADYHGYFTQYSVRLGDRSVSVRVPWSATARI